MSTRSKVLTASLTTLLAWPLSAAKQPPASTPAASKTAATVGGVAIAESEVAGRIPNELQKIEEQRLEVLTSALDDLIESRLVELEAKQRGISSSELLQQEVTLKAPEPTPGEIDAYYEGSKGSNSRPKEELAPQIRSYLLNQRRESARTALFSMLRKKYGVRNFLQEERDLFAVTRAAGLRKLVETSDSPSMGPAGAPVTLVEFSDFECPYCSRVGPTLKQLVSNYGGKVRVVYRQFPLGMHRNAQKAAEASLCANEQGKFWEYHDLLFQEQQKLSVPDLTKKAQQVGLDEPRFAACLNEGAMAERVRKDADAGSQAGVNGTPALVINGKLIAGAVPYDELARTVQEELDRQEAKQASK